jgi:hypothetical protein
MTLPQVEAPRLKQSPYTVVWQPQEGPQTLLIQCPVFEVFYGGARGGGKTDGMLGDWIEHSSQWGAEAIGIFFRRELTQLDEVIARAKKLFTPLGGKYNSQQKEFTMFNGARLKFRYLDKDDDAEKYQGHSYTRVYFEELTNFPSPKPVMMLMATLRSGVVPHSALGFRGTGNPGGPGHLWVKARYIDPAPKGFTVIRTDYENPFTKAVMQLERVFIPSKLSDNRLMMAVNPFYVAQLQNSGSASLVKAWLEGLWDSIEGAYFDNYDEKKHVLDMSWYHTLTRRPGLLRFRAFDWGSAKPFSVGWYAVSDGTFDLPAGALIRYREWYGMEPGKPNVGLRLTNDLIAEGIRHREQGDFIQYGVADPAIFTRQGGPSIAEQMLVKGVAWVRADNSRLAGWQALRERLGADKPMIYFLESCEHARRTLPVLQYDSTKFEDVDSEGEDHAGDEIRYACMSRPWVKDGVVSQVQEPLVVTPKILTFNEAMKKTRSGRVARMERDL